MINSQKNIINFPRFIYFAGVDGTGKSTFVDMLIRDLDKKGVKGKRVWLRFNYFFTRFILLYCRLTGLTRRVDQGEKVISVHDFHKSKRIAKAVQYMHFIDTCIMYFIKVYIPLKFSKTVILCDRFVYDILADFMLESKDMELLDSGIARMFLKLIPRQAIIIFITLDKETILKRKPEVLIDDEDFDLKYDIFKYIESKFNFNIIFNDTDVELVYLNIKELI
ncbi:MAG: thymidylate kinase [Candidatus Zhuqueibacterota bacterium]